MTDKELQTMLDEFDEDGDGRFDRNEFVSAFVQKLEDEFVEERSLYTTLVPTESEEEQKARKEKDKKIKLTPETADACVIGVWSLDASENGGLKKQNNPQLKLWVERADEEVQFHLVRKPLTADGKSQDGLRFHLFDAHFSPSEAPRRLLETDTPVLESGYPRGDVVRLSLPAGLLQPGRAYVVLLSSVFSTPCTAPVPFTFMAKGGGVKLASIPFRGVLLSHTLKASGPAVGKLRSPDNPQFFLHVPPAAVPLQAEVNMTCTTKGSLRLHVQKGLVAYDSKLAKQDCPLPELGAARRLDWAGTDVQWESKYSSGATSRRMVLHITKPGRYTIMTSKVVKAGTPADPDDITLSAYILANPAGDVTSVTLNGATVQDDPRQSPPEDAYTSIIDRYKHLPRCYVRSNWTCETLYSLEDAKTIVDQVTAAYNAEPDASKRKRFVDRHFPPSLEGQINTVKTESSGKAAMTKVPVSFRRFDAIRDTPHLWDAEGGAESRDIRQGNIGDCWLCASFGSLSNRKDTNGRSCVEGLLYPPHYNPAGIYMMKQYILHDASGADEYGYTGGTWCGIILDDTIAVNENSNHRALCFVRNPRRAGEMWAPLLEKGMAKQLGGYRMLKGGTEASALRTMLGGISAGVATNKESADDIFNMIEEALKKNWVVTGSADDPKEDQVMNGKRNAAGIVCNHGYSVLHTARVTIDGKEERLLRLRNPWGQGEFNGKWSDDDEATWKANPSVATALGFGGASNDGAFWMNLEDYLTNFKHMVVCRPYGEEPETSILLLRKEKCLKAIEKAQKKAAS